MRPFIEVDGHMFAVTDWHKKRANYRLRPLTDSELRMYEEIVLSAEIEAYAWVEAKREK